MIFAVLLGVAAFLLWSLNDLLQAGRDGGERVAVPDVVNMATLQARSTLEAAGFTVQEEQLASATSSPTG